MDGEQILGVLLNFIGVGIYDEKRQSVLPRSDPPYFFDLEVFEIHHMYTNFLRELSGILTIRFRCNGTAYAYDAKFYYDWFDPKILSFLNQVINQQNTGKSLYITSDGFQNCIVFYLTKEWAEKFQDLLGICLDRP